MLPLLSNELHEHDLYNLIIGHFLNSHEQPVIFVLVLDQLFHLRTSLIVSFLLTPNKPSKQTIVCFN